MKEIKKDKRRQKDDNVGDLEERENEWEREQIK